MRLLILSIFGLILIGCGPLPTPKFKEGDIVVDKFSHDRYIIISGPKNGQYYVRSEGKAIQVPEPPPKNSYIYVYEAEVELSMYDGPVEKPPLAEKSNAVEHN